MSSLLLNSVWMSPFCAHVTKNTKMKNAKTQKSKNTKNTIPPECRYALVEWIVPSEVWDHHSVLPCLCRKHLDYKKKYMRCSLSNSASNCQGYDAQQHQTIRKHSVSWKWSLSTLHSSCRWAAASLHLELHIGTWVWPRLLFWKKYFLFWQFVSRWDSHPTFVAKKAPRDSPDIFLSNIFVW